MSSKALLELSQEEVAFLCAELEHAIGMHNEWVHQFHVALVTVKRIPDHYIEKDSHFTCTLGGWLERNKGFVERNDDLKEIEKIHHLMHEEACRLSYLYNNEEPIKVGEYDAFIEHKALLEKIIHKLEDSLKLAKTMFDPLTGVFTREALSPLLNHELARMRRQGHESSMAIFDLDYFKSVNDTHGHLVGDRVLRASSEFLKGQMRPYDSIFRYGGEEFLICLSDTSGFDAYKIIDDLRHGLSELPISIDVDTEIYITASAGLADITVGLMVEENISRADQALYAAKKNGQNSVVHYKSLIKDEIVTNL